MKTLATQTNPKKIRRSAKRNQQRILTQDEVFKLKLYAICVGAPQTVRLIERMRGGISVLEANVLACVAHTEAAASGRGQGH